MDRRLFLTMSGAGLLGGWTRETYSGGRSRPGWVDKRFVEESGRYRPIRQIDVVDWIMVKLIPGPRRAYDLEFIDLATYPECSVSVTVPLGEGSAHVDILGEVPYTTGVWSYWAEESHTDVWFADTATVRLYEFTGKLKDIALISRKCRT